MKHVFISYVRENLAEVERLSKSLTAAGISVWLDRENISPGRRWKDAIQTAIRQGGFFIACFSEEYTSRDRTYMNEELVLAAEELRLRPTDTTWFIPVLISACEVPDRRISAAESFRDFQYVELFQDWDRGVKKIIEAIKPDRHSDLFPEEKNAINSTISPEIQRLILELNSVGEEEREKASRRLALQGERVIDPLLHALRYGPADTRVGSSKVLAVLADKLTPAATKPLLDALEDSQSEVQGNAAVALASIGAQEESLTLPIFRLLSTQDLSIRKRTVDALEIIGRVNPDALFSLLNDNKIALRLGASLALCRIGRIDREKCAVTLAEGLSVSCRVSRAFSAWALHGLGKDAKPALPNLLGALSDSDEEVRSCAASAIGRIGRDDEALISTITEVLATSDQQTMPLILEALRLIGPPALTALIAYLRRYPGSDARDHIVKLIAGHGETAIEKVAAIAFLPQDELRPTAIDILSAMGEPAIPILSKLLDSRDPRVARNAYGAVSNIARRSSNPEARDALKSVVPRNDIPGLLIVTMLSALLATQVSWLSYPFDNLLAAIQAAARFTAQTALSFSGNSVSSSHFALDLVGYLAFLVMMLLSILAESREKFRMPILVWFALLELAALIKSFPGMLSPPYISHGMNVLSGLGFVLICFMVAALEEAFGKAFLLYFLASVFLLGTLSNFLTLAGLTSNLFNVNLSLPQECARLFHAPAILWALLFALIGIGTFTLATWQAFKLKP